MITLSIKKGGSFYSFSVSGLKWFGCWINERMELDALEILKIHVDFRFWILNKHFADLPEKYINPPRSTEVVIKKQRFNRQKK
ncbi:unnamed protein product [Rhizophagus irregularis]|nr:unnamed protein product [Rhizophagus irregularis]CAB4437584.1 unnamed protein product [Rhizophagus irregularis]CAB4444224.1 unnamed protein product [Rhizophagus irregularis]